MSNMEHKKYNELNYLEKKIIARKHSALTHKNIYSFPIMILLIVIGYYIYEYVNKNIIFVLILVFIFLLILHEYKLRKWYKDNKITITKKDMILYTDDGEINFLEKRSKDVKEKIRKTKRKRTKKNI